MFTATIISGFTLGLFGSLHCVGMCGPLALALPAHQQGKTNHTIAALMYNSGRVVTYSLLGLLFGFIGKGFSLVGFQQLFSVFAGSVMLLFTILYFGYKKDYQPQWFQQFTWKLQSFIASALQKNKGAFIVGLANGLLPCGMVYAAIAGALVSISVLSSTLFMASFGIATMPAMLLLMLFGSSISIHMRMRLRKLTPFVMAIVAALLILRGMNLGIPYLSPLMQTANAEVLECH
jgi:uncharacterized protein